jgi:hypothetical protein
MNRPMMILLAVAALACSEPKDRVTGTSSDELYTLTVSADPNWVRPNSSLLIRIEVTQNAIPTLPTLPGQVTFEANGGTVNPFSLPVSFPTDSTLVRPTFEGSVTFRASNIQGDGEGQAEIHAFYEGARATLKLRIVPGQ